MPILGKNSSFTATGNDFYKLFDYPEDAPSGLIGAYLLLGDEKNVINQVGESATQPTIVGTPVFTGKGITGTLTNYINTGLAETTSYTILACGRFAQDGGYQGACVFVANQTSLTANNIQGGRLSYFSSDSINNSQLQMYTNANTAGNFPEVVRFVDTETPRDTVSFTAIAKVVDATANRLRGYALDSYVGGTTPTADIDYTPPSSGVLSTRQLGGNWLIGANSIATPSFQDSEVSMVLIFNRALTGAEIGTIYTPIQAQLIANGITF